MEKMCAEFEVNTFWAIKACRPGIVLSFGVVVDEDC